MTGKQIITALFLCATAALLFYSAYTFSAIILFRPAHTGCSGTEKKIGPENALLVNKALRVKMPSQAAFLYQGKFESPFRSGERCPVNMNANADAGSPLPAAVVPGRPKLTIKGLLLAGKPLAILQEESGKITVCGVGDNVGGEKVFAITQNSVTLNDKHGHYDISVRE